MGEFRKEGKNIFYSDENGEYTYVDWGDYLSASRDPLDPIPVTWRLTYFKGTLNNEQVNIEALFDRYSKTHSRILINGRAVFLTCGTFTSGSSEDQQIATWFINAEKTLLPELIDFTQNTDDHHYVA